MFGPLVAFGPGGALAELIGDAGFRLAPLTDLDADELVPGGQGGPARRRLPRRASRPTRGALVDLVVRLGRLAEDLPRGGRARPEPGARRADRLRRGRRPRSGSRPAGRAAREGLVAGCGFPATGSGEALMAVASRQG